MEQRLSFVAELGQAIPSAFRHLGLAKTLYNLNKSIKKNGLIVNFESFLTEASKSSLQHIVQSPSNFIGFGNVKLKSDTGKILGEKKMVDNRIIYIDQKGIERSISLTENEPFETSLLPVEGKVSDIIIESYLLKEQVGEKNISSSDFNNGSFEIKISDSNIKMMKSGNNLELHVSGNIPLSIVLKINNKLINPIEENAKMSDDKKYELNNSYLLNGTNNFCLEIFHCVEVPTNINLELE